MGSQLCACADAADDQRLKPLTLSELTSRQQGQNLHSGSPVQIGEVRKERDIYTLSKRQLAPQKITHDSDDEEDQSEEEGVNDGESGADMMFERQPQNSAAGRRPRNLRPIQASSGESLMLNDVFSDSNHSQVDRTSNQWLHEQKRQLKKLIQARRQVQQAFNLHGRSDKNSFDCSKTQHYQTPRGRLSRQRIVFEVLVSTSDAKNDNGNFSGSHMTRSQINASSQSYRKQRKNAVVSSARSAIAGKVKVFQFGGGNQGQRSTNYFELSDDQQSSPNLHDQDVETEFSRLKEGCSLNGVQGRQANRSTAQGDRIQALQDATTMTLFYEDFIAMQRKKRSKSLDQIHTIVLSDQIYERKDQKPGELENGAYEVHQNSCDDEPLRDEHHRRLLLEQQALSQ